MSLDSPTLTEIVTPVSEHDYVPTGNLKSDHSELASLAQMPTPQLDSHTRNYPLLPHHPLVRQKLDRDRSPPHTPKGHPIELHQLRWPKPKTNPINPYPRSTFGWVFPRRFRPLAVIMFCCVVFGLVHLNNVAQQARQLETFSHQQAAALGRRRAAMSEHREKRREMWPVEPVASGSYETIKFDNREEELAALIAFVTSTTSNSLPSLDPTERLDPAVVLDFDPSRRGAREDLDLLVAEINTIYPLVLVGKMRDPWHREMKKLLAEYKITPAPLVIDADQRRDHRVFIPLMSRLLGTTELPQLLLHGKILGSYHEVLELKEKGELSLVLEAGGVSVRDAKKKKKGVKERERVENERILGPAPIRDV